MRLYGEAMRGIDPDALACPEYVYCLFCRSGSEKTVAQAVQQKLNCEAIVPRIERDEHRSGKWEKRVIDMLPGYIFLYSDVEADIESLKGKAGALKVLRYDDGSNRLLDDDLRFAEWLYKNGGTIGISTAVKEGTKIRVTGGPLLDYAGSIIEVKRQKRIAKVAIKLGGVTREVWMSFAWLSAENEQADQSIRSSLSDE